MKNKTVITLIVLAMFNLSLQDQVSALTATDTLPSQVQGINSFDQKSSVTFSAQETRIPQDCKTNGDETEGSSLCRQTYSDGSYATSESHHEKAWNEIKIQTFITRFDAQGMELGKQTVRRKTDFTDDSQKIRTKDSFDIVSFPPGQKITREVLIFEYQKDGKTFSKISYAKYNQIEDLAFASLIYNVTLRYDEKGFPLRGRAERWANGSRASDFFRWSREVNGMEKFDPAAWKQWEEITKRASLMEALF